MSEESFVSPGSGVPRASAEEIADQGGFLGAIATAEPDEVVAEAQEDLDSSGDTVWSDTPTYADQWWRFPETCRPGPPITAVFKLKDQADVDRLNTLMAGVVPESAPSIVLVSGVPPQWAEDISSFVELVKYRKVQYKRLIKQQ